MAEQSKRDELRDAVKQELDALIAGLAQPFNWTPYPYSADVFGATGGMIWTVQAGNVGTLQYLRLSPTVLVLAWDINNTSVSGAVSTGLRLRLPEGLVAAKTMPVAGWGLDNGAGVSQVAYSTAGDQRLTISRFDLANWAASTRQTRVSGCIILDVAAPIGR